MWSHLLSNTGTCKSYKIETERQKCKSVWLNEQFS